VSAGREPIWVPGPTLRATIVFPRLGTPADTPLADTGAGWLTWPSPADPAGLAAKVRRAVREGASPRHVPDEIIATPAIPHTRTGKKLEIPVKRILQGGDPSQVMDAGAVDNPDALRWFAGWRAEARA
jgi:hypothetical protein